MPFTALQNRPIATNDGKYLIVPSASTKLHCLDGADGKALWTNGFEYEERASIYMTEARLSRDDSNVYVIRVRQCAMFISQY